MATKPAQFRVGIVSVTEGRTAKKDLAYWELRYVDRATGLEVRRRVSGLDRQEVSGMADNLTKQAYADKGYLPGRMKAPLVGEGITEAVQLAGTLDQTCVARLRWSAKFVAWLAERYPACKTWADLRPAMVKGFKLDLEKRGLSFNTVRLALAPLKLAWRHMVESYPDMVRPLPRIKQKAPPRREIECLEAHEVDILLVWLRENARDVWPIATLQALAGLRMLEAAALRFQDVDFEAGILTVTDTGHHCPKTRDSYRIIPLCAEALGALRAAATEQKVRPATGELFTNQDGSLWSVSSLTHRMTRTLRRAAAKPEEKIRSNGWKLPLNKNGLDMPRLKAFPARRLRASFATMAGRLGVSDRLLKAYMGHTAGDILGGHYRRIDMEELRSVSGAIERRSSLGERKTDRKETGDIEPAAIAAV
ncbi:MAG: site-specific integrase [Candidatus Sumerlaeota bacterium]|nr:site-specific integrase [Candidatus Sumerlaeota bacterium]